MFRIMAINQTGELLNRILIISIIIKNMTDIPNNIIDLSTFFLLKDIRVKTASMM